MSEHTISEDTPIDSISNGRVGMVSLGCPKNSVDSEKILTQLQLNGYEISNSYSDADVVVVNTCGFIDAAKQESLDAIREAMTENGKVIVTGCMGKGADAELIKEENPGVLAITGAHAYEEVMDAVHEWVPPTQEHNPFIDLVPEEGVKLTPRHYSYLKISEGCNHSCTFCIIPDMRGKLASRPVGDVLDEAKRLVAAGTKELLVISQDTSAYGVDLKYRTGFWDGMPVKTKLYDLCKQMSKLGAWVRLHYVYPYPSVDDIMPLMAEGKVLPYLDIPFQHASPRVLKLMKRPAHSENTLERIKKWREQVPNLVLRSTFVVGFPGETEEDFQILLDWLDDAELDRVGCFKYSPVEGAKANDLPDHVPEDIQQDRWERFMAKAQEISTRKLARRVGQQMTVLIDEIDDEGAIGRTYADAPNIDGMVYLNGYQDCQPGDLIEVVIEHSDEYDLWGTPI
ncbi:ribosomal protein S12 methylthiotransferase [Thalassolituus sp. HI0120]|nr:ribosomal protein S12 methylthiotransferase [Thalassolituus sp. HI0120]